MKTRAFYIISYCQLYFTAYYWSGDWESTINKICLEPFIYKILSWVFTQQFKLLGELLLDMIPELYYPVDRSFVPATLILKHGSI